MANSCPREFRDDVVGVAQCREYGVTIKQIAEDFGISEGCLRNWLPQAEIKAGKRPGATASESAELRERSRLLEQEQQALRRGVEGFRRRTCRDRYLPARERPAQWRDSRRDCVSGIEGRSSVLLPVASQPLQMQ